MMSLRSTIFFLLPFTFCLSCYSPTGKQNKKNQDGKKIELVKHNSEKKVDIMVDGKLFTSYRWHDSMIQDIKKPVLYPIMASGGIEVTRGYPLDPRSNERTDHPHQIGLCFNYGNVNGYDFWNNSTAIPKNQKDKYGTIRHVDVEKLSGGYGQGILIANESWIDPAGKELLAERTEYYFLAQNQTRIIDRITTLTANQADISMKDTKEGGFGIRVARQLEIPSNEEVTLTDAQGIPTKVKRMSNQGVTGNYRSSNGATGEDVFATRGEWVNLFGEMDETEISIVMIDHPDNPGYPTYWHARGYGLLLANPLGAGIYSHGKNMMNFNIPAGKSATFKFRLIVHSGNVLTDSEINTYAEEFAGKY